MMTYVGQNLGAGKIHRIRQGVRVGSVVCVAISGVICTAMLLLGRFILSGFISGSPDTAAQALDIAYEYLTAMSLCLPVLYILYVVRAAIQGMGNTLLSLVSGFAELAMRTAGVLLLPVIFGYSGIFYAEVLAWLGADLILVPGYILLMRRLRNGKNDR